MLIVRDNNTYNKQPVLEQVRMKLEELKVTIRVCKEVQAVALHFRKSMDNRIIENFPRK